MKMLPPEFLQVMQKYTRAVEDRQYGLVTEAFRGRFLSDILVPCEAKAVLGQSGMRKAYSVRTASVDRRKLLLDVLCREKEPYDSLKMIDYAKQIGFVQTETLIDLLHNIQVIGQSLKREDPDLPVTIIKNEPLTIKTSEGKTLIRSSNDIVIENDNKRVVILVRTAPLSLLDVRDIYYVSLLGNLMAGKKVEVSAVVRVDASEDLVRLVTWRAEPSKDHSNKWFEKLAYDFIYNKHKGYSPDVLDNLTDISTIKNDRTCSSCSFHSFCAKYIKEESESE